MLELNKIYNMECLEGLRKLEDNSIDLIVTDPPYGINFTKRQKDGGKDFIVGDDGFSVMVFLDEILSEFKRVLKPNSAIYIFTRFDVFPYWWLKLKNYFIAKNQIVWHKGGGGMGDTKGNYAYDYESIMFVTNGKHQIRGKREGTVWRIPKCKPEYHMTQKPIELIEKIVEHSSDKGMVILDPFMGSGTTALACMNKGRYFIGFEVLKEYCETANERIASQQTGAV